MKKILIVDDAMFIRSSLKLMLENNGFEVIGEAGNGYEAIDKYKVLKPDIVTMDITMPEMDGIESLRQIKEYDKNANVVMITALGQESFVKEAIMLGAKGFIVKPFKEETVVKALSKF
ncbi:response regulator [Defluviitalea raffinosedens]|jgi:two-component system chemotaxis response regulator CheY|uniref:Stage 0 sporulation protein A homolog n=1 Tax=Defluviitalea raffinosedens TaxID=1450156 RepID=A0A7C8HFY0_9FIRM|nr:response regulator [Defluviitalea raffinosedens]KAE9636345.1 response regulator [Defluviitalea raffinosedens]MBM7685352.1 two-component system chemotaxis response regulator CheY [Defluviitalea raffinosedens]HHW66327.1 response regulator [Candidatus Epulonipiscium sp.]